MKQVTCSTRRSLIFFPFWVSTTFLYYIEEKLIFRKFLNIKMMVNLRKSLSTSYISINKHKLDKIFDIYLRPLKNKNTRIIFTIFVEELDVGYLTTLDLQTRLSRININLSKKEINGWLRLLQESELISKGEIRGKPTTLDYYDKYTFDMWRLTSQGIQIAEGLNNLLRSEIEVTSFPLKKWLGELILKDNETRQLMLKEFEETYIQILALKTLLKEGSPLTSTDLRERIFPKKRNLLRLILEGSDNTFFRQEIRATTDSFVWRLIRFLGFSLKRDNTVSLTEEGQKIAEKIWLCDS